MGIASPYISLKRVSFIILMIMLTVAGCSKSKSSYDYLSQARHHHQQGNDKSALIDIKNALQKDPKNGEARFFLAKLFIVHDQGSAAEIELQKAIKLGVNKSYVAETMGQALLLQHKYQKIIDTIEVADGDSGQIAAGIYSARGDAFLGLKQIDDARSAYQDALKEYSDSSDAYVGLAKLAIFKDDMGEALHEIDIALSKDQKNTRALLIKAGILQAQQKFAEAVASYNQMLKVDKNSVSALLGLASIDIVKNEPDKAKSEIDAALKISPDSLAVRYALALVQFKRGKFKEAQEAIEDVLKTVPDHAPSNLLHGAIAYSLGSYEQARADISGVLAQFPGDAYARRLLAASLLKLKESNKALEILQPLTKPQSVDAQALALAGEIELQEKNYEAASKYLQRAIEINPSSEQLQTQLAISHLGSSDSQQGLKELESIAKQAPSQSSAGMILIVTYLQHKDYDKALKAISSFDDKAETNPVTLGFKGVALLGKEDYSGARKAFEQALAKDPLYIPAIEAIAQLDIHDDKPDEARQRLENALKDDKNNFRLIMDLAELARHQKQEQNYLSRLEEAKKAKPNLSLPYVKLVNYYLAKKNNKKALEIATEAVKNNPNSLDALGLLGATQSAAGDANDALKTFSNLAMRAPNIPASYLQLAKAQFAAKRLNAARVSLDKAMKLKPDLRQAQELLVRIDLAEGKESDALKVARQLEQSNSSSPVGYDIEADILMERKEYKQAIAAYGQALNRGAGALGLIKLHHALTVAGDDKSADQRLIAWINQNPKDLVVREYAAKYYSDHNRIHDAIIQYEEIYKYSPTNVVVLNNLANLYQKTNDNRALSVAEKAIKLAPDSPSVQDTLGWILVNQGDLTRALELLRKAATNKPKLETIHYHFAVALARSGHKDEAKKELKAVINGGKQFPELKDAKTLLKGL